MARGVPAPKSSPDDIVQVMTAGRRAGGAARRRDHTRRHRGLPAESHQPLKSRSLSLAFEQTESGTVEQARKVVQSALQLLTRMYLFCCIATTRGITQHAPHRHHFAALCSLPALLSAPIVHSASLFAARLAGLGHEQRTCSSAAQGGRRAPRRHGWKVSRARVLAHTRGTVAAPLFAQVSVPGR